MPWSPSSVNDFMACPRLWWLKRQRVVERARDETAMGMGTLFHQHMAAFWGDNREGVPPADPLIDRAVARVVTQEGVALREQGVVGIEVNLDGDDAEAARHGKYPGTADLITDNGAGLTVTDYKTKMKLDDQYVDAELRQTARAWQFLQYAWFAQVKFERQVTQVRKLLVRFAPLKVWLTTVEVTQEQLARWHVQAQNVWRRMDVVEQMGQDEVEQHEASCERFGWAWRCGMYGYCWDGQELTYKESDECHS